MGLARVESARPVGGTIKPARLYDLRSTFGSGALAAGITVYGLVRWERASA